MIWTQLNSYRAKNHRDDFRPLQLVWENKEILMGRGGTAESTTHTATTSRGMSRSPEERALAEHKYFVRGYERRLREAAAGKATLADQEEAKARAMRPLADRDDEQRRLIAAAQAATGISLGVVRQMVAQGGMTEALAKIDALAVELDRPPSFHEVLLRTGLSRQDLMAAGTPRQRALLHDAQSLNQAAREPFLLCHTGFVNQMIGRYVHQFDGEPTEDARLILKQAARVGLNKGIDKYDPSVPAKPLTYCKNWIRAEISAVTESEGRLIRLKSKAHDLGKRVQATAKDIKSEGRQPTVDEIATQLNEPTDKVAEVLDYVTQHTVRFDAPVSSQGEGETTVGALTADNHQDIESPAFDADMHQAIRAAVSEIDSAYQRRIIELCYGLVENETAEQKDLFDGVYRDGNGQAYSAEQSVITERGKHNETVEKRSQKDLNDRFSKGLLVFEPGTAEAHELARLQKSEHYDPESYDPDAPFATVITRETGVPPTSGTVQEAKKKAEKLMRSHASLQGLRPRYRGINELENSHAARQEVRLALVKLGAVSWSDAAKLRAGKDTQQGLGTKGPLRLLAEQYQLVDHDSGRMKLDRLFELLDAPAEEASDDFAALMSEV
jgi:DNA-directed RNA polymerase specialized sigma subunit